MDLSNLAPDLGKLLGLNPSTLVLLVIIINRGAAAWARAIPNTSTGFWGFMRQLFAVIGTEVSTQITPTATAADILKAAAATPPIDQKVQTNSEQKD